MIYVQIRDYQTDRRGPWTTIPEAPHRITVETLRACRAEWQTALDASPGPLGAELAPQTTAREILERALPGLQSFDAIALGFAVTATACRVSEAPDGPWERLP